VRVDLWEQHAPDWDQPGKPYTSVQLRAALVDSLGRLLWSASGGETAEGLYYDPGTGSVSAKDSGIDRSPTTGRGGAPSFREVLTALLGRWASQFPPKPSVASAAPASAGPASGAADSAGVAPTGGAPPDSAGAPGRAGAPGK